MVHGESIGGAPGYRFVIRPNASMTWREAGVVYAAFAVVTLTIAAGFAWAGLVWILPFSGLELLALGWVFYICLRRGERQEVITIDDNTVRVERGLRRCEESHEFQRGWIRVTLEAGAHHWYPARLLMGSHGRRVEVGEFLTEDEREGLATELKRVLTSAVPTTPGDAGQAG